MNRIRLREPIRFSAPAIRLYHEYMSDEQIDVWFASMEHFRRVMDGEDNRLCDRVVTGMSKGDLIKVLNIPNCFGNWIKVSRKVFVDWSQSIADLGLVGASRYSQEPWNAVTEN
jgi:hypothetical protein